MDSNDVEDYIVKSIKYDIENKVAEAEPLRDEQGHIIKVPQVNTKIPTVLNPKTDQEKAKAKDVISYLYLIL